MFAFSVETDVPVFSQSTDVVVVNFVVVLKFPNVMTTTTKEDDDDDEEEHAKKILPNE